MIALVHVVSAKCFPPGTAVALCQNAKRNRPNKPAHEVHFSFTYAIENSLSGAVFDAVSPAGSKSWRMVESASYEQLGLAFLGVLADVAPFVHASFLLFDFKQNLRHWPVLAGDISRSPPFFAAPLILLPSNLLL